MLAPAHEAGVGLEPGWRRSGLGARQGVRRGRISRHGTSEQDSGDGTEAPGDDDAAAGDEEETTPAEADAPEVPFDPDDAIPFTDLEVQGEPIFPTGPMPDSLGVPAGTTVATYSAEMGDNVQYHNATGALRVDDTDAEPEQVMAFFPQHLADAGWELAEQRDNGMQVWEREHPDERVWTQQFRVETVKSGDHATIRWWFTNNG